MSGKSSPTSNYVLNYETFMAFGIYTKNGCLYLGNALAQEQCNNNLRGKISKIGRDFETYGVLEVETLFELLET